jgi:hypothetical protein
LCGLLLFSVKSSPIKVAARSPHQTICPIACTRPCPSPCRKVLPWRHAAAKKATLSRVRQKPTV